MKIKNVVLFALVLFCMSLVGCKESSKSSNGKNPYENDPTANPMNAEWTRPRQAAGHNQLLKNADEGAGTVHYGENVYYFTRTEASFANSLVFFLVNHTNLEVTAIAPNVIRLNGEKRRELTIDPYTADYGVAVGYFVTFREK